MIFLSGTSYDFYLEAVERAGPQCPFSHRCGPSSDFYTIQFHSGAVRPQDFANWEVKTPPGRAYLLNKVRNGECAPTVLLNRVTEIGRVREVDGIPVQRPVHSFLRFIDRSWIPRDMADIDGTGKAICPGTGARCYGNIEWRNIVTTSALEHSFCRLIRHMGKRLLRF